MKEKNTKVVTRRGKKWESSNSWWVILLLVPFLQGLGFLNIGLKGRKISWLIAGLFYLLAPYYVVFSLGIHPIAKFILSVVLWFAAIIHGALLIEKYLVRREAILDAKLLRKGEPLPTAPPEEGEEVVREEMISDPIDDMLLEEKNRPDTQAMQPDAIAGQSPSNGSQASSEALTEKIDLNTCPADVLVKLPGVSVAAAKRAVELRGTKGGFQSVEDFVVSLGIKPHFVPQLENMAYVSQLSEIPIKAGGRVLDL